MTRRLNVADFTQIKFSQSTKNIGIVSAIPNALEFGHPCCANHVCRVRSGFRLLANVTVVVTIVGEVVWGFLHWDVTGCAATIFNVERAIDVLRMWSNRFGHRFIGLAAERRRSPALSALARSVRCSGLLGLDFVFKGQLLLVDVRQKTTSIPRDIVPREH